ncbi:MAG: sce7726 family protein [Methylococcaceae bacterium]
MLETNQLSSISRLFSPSLIRELARKGRSPIFARLATETPLLEFSSPQAPVRNLFDSAFSLLKRKNYRHEYIYKAAITHKVLLGIHSLQTAVMLNEFRVGVSKADTVILNGTSTVYEIKSERDSLNRLEQQISSYQRVFAKVNVITGDNHLKVVLTKVPQEVGVLLLTNRFQISTIREAVDCRDQIISEAVFDSIQLNEAKQILKKMGIEIPKLPNTQMHQALRNQFVTLSPIDAHNGMVNTLRITRSLLPLANFVKSLPYSLQAVALSTPLRKQDHARLLNAMDTPINEALKWN